ncbi:kinase-like domain-containing protein [Aspergillus recurvatus]
MAYSSTLARNSMLPHLYVPIEDVEKLERYRTRGYHPVMIGDRFQNRYHIVHKLGYGSYSTIWLARDEKVNQFVAVKVCTADANPHELNVLAHLSALRQNSSVSAGRGEGRGRDMIPSILDAFKIDGPNGTHSCYVTPPARMSLSDTKDASYIRLFTPDVARALAAQLAVAVEYLHSQGYAHGDLHHGNVLIQMPSGFDYNQCSQPELIPITRFDGKDLSPDIPCHAIVPVWLGKASEKLSLPEAKILLSDFGESFSPSDVARFESGNTPLSYPADIWSLACTIWDIIGQSPLFEGFLAGEDDMTCEHVDALGILPPEWWSKWEPRQTRFNEDGKPLDKRSYRSWEDRLEDSVQQPRRVEGMSVFEPAERDALFLMLRSMLSFRPESRPSAEEVLASEWMVKWALPEAEKAWEA